MSELIVSTVYRLSYSLSVKASYNLLYVDNVALAPENYNTRDLSNALGSGSGAFTVNRHPFIDVDGEVLYQGWSIGGEYLGSHRQEVFPESSNKHLKGRRDAGLFSLLASRYCSRFLGGTTVI